MFVKVYPRFSETFVVTEILARERAGEQLVIYASRPTTDARFQPGIAQVQAPVTHLSRPHKASEVYAALLETERAIPGALAAWASLTDILELVEPSDAFRHWSWPAVCCATASPISTPISLRRPPGLPPSRRI